MKFSNATLCQVGKSKDVLFAFPIQIVRPEWLPDWKVDVVHQVEWRLRPKQGQGERGRGDPACPEVGPENKETISITSFGLISALARYS